MSPLTVVWSPAYEVDIGAHVFPTAKYRLVRDEIVARGVVREDAFVHPPVIGEADLLRVHTPEYVRKVRTDDFTSQERLTLEVPFGPALREASLLACGGTLLAARRALEERVALHLGGGFHHAFADHGEGFCLLNDVAVAAATLLAEDGVEHVLVVDLDVHHGNGTASIFAREPRVTTFSMHQERNYPAVKPPSDVDVGLDDGTGDPTYLDLLERHLGELLERRRPTVVLYLAGADPYREDQLGGLSLSKEGLRRRDALVLDHAREAGAAVAVVLAGGYAVREADTVSIHAATAAESARVAERRTG